MLVLIQSDMESPFDIRTVPLTLTSVRFGCLLVTNKPCAAQSRRPPDNPLRWDRPLGKLFRRQVLAKVGAGRVMELLEQIGQSRAVSQRQTDRQVEPRPARHVIERRVIRRGCGYVVVENCRSAARAEATNRPSNNAHNRQILTTGGRERSERDSVRSRWFLFIDSF